MNKGFTLLESLIALLVSSCIFQLLLMTQTVLHHNQIMPYLAQDVMSSYQLQRIFMLSTNIEQLDETTLEFDYLGEKRWLVIEHNRAFMQDGMVIYFNDIDDAMFEINGKDIYFFYQRLQREYKLLIGVIDE